MIWNLAIHTAAGYFGSGMFTLDSKGITTCLVITALVQGIDMIRIYREIEDCETWDSVLKTIDKGLAPFKSILQREYRYLCRW